MKHAEALINRIIRHIESDMDSESHFLCNMNISFWGIKGSTGAWLKYFALLESQKPSEGTNTEFFNHVSFYDNYAWWDYVKTPNETVNREKIKFLKHIKTKL